MNDQSSTPRSPGDAPIEIDNAASAEIFIDGLSGLQLRNGVMKLNFYSNRRRGDGKDHAIGVATLVVPLPDFVGMVAGMNQMVRQLIDQGILPQPQDSHGEERNN
jgi:hypothetical protein